MFGEFHEVGQVRCPRGGRTQGCLVNLNPGLMFDGGVLLSGPRGPSEPGEVPAWHLEDKDLSDWFPGKAGSREAADVTGRMPGLRWQQSWF